LIRSSTGLSDSRPRALDGRLGRKDESRSYLAFDYRCAGLEQLDRVSVGIKKLDLSSARTNLHLVSKLQARLAAAL
jgi:hypothetical protein